MTPFRSQVGIVNSHDLDQLSNTNLLLGAYRFTLALLNSPSSIK